MEKLTRNIYPGLLCGIVILILTGLPGSCFPTVKPAIGLDKLVHVAMYAGFSFISLWGYRDAYIRKSKTLRWKALGIMFLISCSYGILTEVMQETICYQRTGSVYDFIADVIGTLLGIAFFAILYRKKNKIVSKRVS